MPIKKNENRDLNHSSPSKIELVMPPRDKALDPTYYF